MEKILLSSNVMSENGKRQNRYIIFSLLILVEYVNSLLRYFEIIDMSKGVTLRKLIFVFILISAFYFGVRKMQASSINTFYIPQTMLSFIVMYAYFIFIYFLNAKQIDITDISNMIMPFIMGAIGYISNFPLNLKRYNVFLMIYVLVLSGMYLVNVRYGEFNYTPVGLNSIYYIVLIFPLVFAIKNKLVKKILIGLIMGLTIVSWKTTAILCVCCCLLVYYFVKDKKITWRIVVFPVVFLSTFLIIYIISDVALGMNIIETYISSNISDGGNGRLDIWANVFEVFCDGNIIQILFGRGFDATLKIIGRSAHNDYLEVLFCFGIVGISLLMINLFKCLKYGWEMFKADYKYAAVFFMLLAETVIMFFFSNLLYVASYILIIVINMFTIISDYKRWKAKEVIGEKI